MKEIDADVTEIIANCALTEIISKLIELKNNGYQKLYFDGYNASIVAIKDKSSEKGMPIEKEKISRCFIESFTIDSLEGMIKEIREGNIGSPEWNLYKNLILGGWNYFENKTEDK